MNLLHDMKFSVRGFSPKRMAYLLVGISAVLLPFHAVSVALLILFPVLVLGLFTPRSDRHRFLPQLLGLALFVIYIVIEL